MGFDDRLSKGLAPWTRTCLERSPNQPYSQHKAAVEAGRHSRSPLNFSPSIPANLVQDTVLAIFKADFFQPREARHLVQIIRAIDHSKESEKLVFDQKRRSRSHFRDGGLQGCCLESEVKQPEHQAPRQS